MTSATIAYSISAAIGLVACAYWTGWIWFRQRGRWTPNRAATVGYSGLFGLASFLSIPPVVTAIDTAVGIPELPRLVKHLCVFGIACFTQYQLLHLAYPAPTARRAMGRRVAVAGAGSVLLILMYALVRSHPGAAETRIEYAHVPAVTAYLGVYVATLTWYAVDTPRLCWRFSRVSPRKWTRRGFAVATVGTSVTIAYCLAKAFYVSSYWIGVPPVGERIVNPLLVMTAGGLAMIGLSMPTWGPGVDAIGRWRANRRAYRQLYPLWLALTRTKPDLVLDVHLRRSRAPLRRVEYALTRRVVEICDARLAMRPYIDEDVVERLRSAARHKDGTDTEALAEAIQVAVGVRGRQADRPAARPSTGSLHDPGGYDRQVAWLVRVAAAYRSRWLHKAVAEHLPTTRTPSGVAGALTPSGD